MCLLKFNILLIFWLTLLFWRNICVCVYIYSPDIGWSRKIAWQDLVIINGVFCNSGFWLWDMYWSWMDVSFWSWGVSYWLLFRNDMNNWLICWISMNNWVICLNILNVFFGESMEVSLWYRSSNHFLSCLSFMLFLKINISLIFCCFFLFFLLCLKFLISNVLLIFFLAFFFWWNISFCVNNYLVWWSGSSYLLRINMSHWLWLMIKMMN